MKRKIHVWMMYTNNNLLKFEIFFNIRKMQLIENDWNNAAGLRLLFILYTNLSLSISNKCPVTSLFSDSFEFYYYSNDSSIQCYRSRNPKFLHNAHKRNNKILWQIFEHLFKPLYVPKFEIMLIDKECKEDRSWWYELQWTVTWYHYYITDVYGYIIIY